MPNAFSSVAEGAPFALGCLLDYAILLNFSRLSLFWRFAFFPTIIGMVYLLHVLLPSSVREWVLSIFVFAAIVMPFAAAHWWFKFWAGIHEELSGCMASVVYLSVFIALFLWGFGKSGGALQLLALAGFTLLLGFIWKMFRGCLARRRESRLVE